MGIHVVEAAGTVMPTMFHSGAPARCLTSMLTDEGAHPTVEGTQNETPWVPLPAVV